MKFNEIAKNAEFDSLMESIKEFSEQEDPTITLKTVAEKGLLGIKKDVKAEDFNDLALEVQKGFKYSNSANIAIRKEFMVLYNVIDKLNNGYVQGLIVNQKEINKNHKDIKNQNDDLNKVVQMHEQLLNGLQTTVGQLQRFISKLDEHIKNDDNEAIKEDLSNFKKSLKPSKEKIAYKIMTCISFVIAIVSLILIIVKVF